MAELKNIRGNYLAQKLGNFPLDCECLNYAQKRDDISQALGCIGGDRVLLSGFNADGSGLVFVKTNECPWGEVMPVKAGSGSTLHLVSEPVRVDFSAEDVFPQAYFDRYLEYGTVYGAGAENFPVSSFWKLRNNKVIYEALQAEMQTREAADSSLRQSVNFLSSSLSSEQSARDTAVRELKEQLLREIRSEVSSASDSAASSLSAEVEALNKRIADLEASLSSQISNAQNTADTAAEGLASTQYVNSEISRLSDKIDNGLDDAKTTAQNDLMKRLPRGVITAWYGSENTIPSGWALCDGQNGTPNLIDRFVLGGPVPSRLPVSGYDNFTIEEKNLPTHSHALWHDETKDGGTITYTPIVTYGGLRRVKIDGKGDGNTFSYGTCEQKFYTGNTGNGENVSYMPKYYQLCYIMKL